MNRTQKFGTYLIMGMLYFFAQSIQGSDFLIYVGGDVNIHKDDYIQIYSRGDSPTKKQCDWDRNEVKFYEYRINSESGGKRECSGRYRDLSQKEFIVDFEPSWAGGSECYEKRVGLKFVKNIPKEGGSSSGMSDEQIDALELRKSFENFQDAVRIYRQILRAPQYEMVPGVGWRKKNPEFGPDHIVTSYRNHSVWGKIFPKEDMNKIGEVMNYTFEEAVRRAKVRANRRLIRPEKG